MITKFANAIQAGEQSLKTKIGQLLESRGCCFSYESLLKLALETVAEESDEYGDPDPSKIRCIDDGDYQGTLLFIVPARGYQPNNYWAVKVFYGSCSYCDTLEGIQSDSGDREKQVNDYYTLCLHMIQGMSEIGTDAV